MEDNFSTRLVLRLFKLDYQSNTSCPNEDERVPFKRFRLRSASLRKIGKRGVFLKKVCCWRGKARKWENTIHFHGNLALP